MEEQLGSLLKAKTEVSKNLLSGLKVGLLGGAFNPAHYGHVNISLYAIEKLDLDLVLWLVAPNHPFKGQHQMLALEKRLAYANKLTSTHPDIIATDIENILHTSYTVDTLTKMQQLFPNAKFIWLMGADNLLQMPKWRRWQDIFKLLPIAVFQREPYSSDIKGCEAMKLFKSNLIANSDVAKLCNMKLPAWTVLENPNIDISSTAIREAKKNLT